MKILLVKTSSLGDVINTLPSVEDLRAAYPDAQLDWLVESSYRDIPSWHPFVHRVIHGEFRRWRKTPFKPEVQQAWRAFKSELQHTTYDWVIDAQGLLKSAFLTLYAHGPRAGRGWRTIPEKPAAWFWHRSYDINPQASEVQKVRQLLAGIVGYPEPLSPARFGLSKSRFSRPMAAPYVFLAHGAGWPSKLWPVENWQALACYFRQLGLEVVLTWGDAAEQARAQHLAAQAGVIVLPKQGLNDIAPWLAYADGVVGLDTGLTHLAVALGTPTLCLYGPSVPVLLDQPHLMNVCATEATTVDRQRPNTLSVAMVIDQVQRHLGTVPALGA